MKVRLADIQDIEPKRDHGDIRALKESIKDVGLICPVAITEDYRLLAGRRRYQALIELGWEEVDCHIIPINGDRLLAFRIALHENLKRKPLTDPEVAMAIKEYDELKRKLEGEQPRGKHHSSPHCGDDGWTQDKTATDLGISRQAVGKAVEIATAIDKYPELITEPSGQSILLGYKAREIHKQRAEDVKQLTSLENLILGDARIELKKLADDSIDCVITDPPYGISYVSGYREYANDVTISMAGDSPTDALDLWGEVCPMLADKMKANSHLYVFTSWKVYPQFMTITMQYFKIKNLLIWVKNNWSMGDLFGNYAEQYEMIIFATKGNRELLGARPTNVLLADRVPNNQLMHAAEKPIELIEKLLRHSTIEGELVVDPFSGTGAILKAAKNLNRQWLGIDIDEGTYQIALQRLS